MGEANGKDSDLKAGFLQIYSRLQSELLEGPAFSFTEDSRQWVDWIIPAAKKFKMVGVEPELEAKLETMFGGVVASGRFSAAPSQTAFASTPNNEAVELSNDSAGFQSVDPPEIQSTNRTKRPVKQKKRKSGHASVREQLSYLVESSNDAPHKVQRSSVYEVVTLLEEELELTLDRDLFYFAIDLLRDSLHRDFFTALSKDRRVEYIRYYYDRRHM